MYIALSPDYTVRNEAEVSFLIRRDTIINLRNTDSGTFCIPPFVGYILSHVGDLEYQDSLATIAKALNVSRNAIDNFVQQLVDNQENKKFKFSDTESVISRRCC